MQVFPQAEHRWCARHIFSNWSKKYGIGEVKKKFFVFAWSTFEEEFKDNLLKLGELTKKGVENVPKYPPHTWCRAYFSSRSKSWMVDNNIAECFNSWILAARHKPIVSMLEDIRLQAMNRIANNKIAVEKWYNEWSPTCMRMFEDNKENSAGCKVVFNGDVGYEIGEGADKHTVFLDKDLCTCRAWDLTGIPCSHAICAMNHSKINPINHISKWYHKSTYVAAYEHPLQPVPGKRFMRCDEYEAIEPPPQVRLSGRPRTKRVRGSNEPRATGNSSNNEGKLGKKGLKQKCGLCHQTGHNRRLCPNKGNQVYVQ